MELEARLPAHRTSLRSVALRTRKADGAGARGKGTQTTRSEAIVCLNHQRAWCVALGRVAQPPRGRTSTTLVTLVRWISQGPQAAGTLRGRLILANEVVGLRTVSSL